VLATHTGGDKIINFGGLTTSGDLANGVFADADNVSVRNFGAVETSGLGAAGIFVEGANARIENFGSVHTTGDFFGDFAFFSEGIFALGDGFYIANHGTIQVEGLPSSAVVGAGADGLIINFGLVEGSAPDSVVVAVDGDRSQFVNKGQVISSGPANAVVFVAGDNASAVNFGEILITGDFSTGILGVTSNTQLTNRGVIRLIADESTAMTGIGDGHLISNFGLIETEGNLAFGMTLGFPPASNGKIVNSGVLETVGDGAAGVVMIGNGHQLINSGQIRTDGGTFQSAAHGEVQAAGVLVSGDDAVVVNTRTGVITSENAGSAAVELNVLERDGLSNADTASTLDNFGRIEGAVAVLGGDGQEQVINHGRIVGDVDLGAGDDEFVSGKSGILIGDLILGGGDDHVLIENGAGTTRIADFVAGDSTDDDIDVSAFFSNLDDLKAESEQIGTDVIIALDHNDTLVLVGVQLSTLNVDDFSFV
jgi:hypothetical protein